MCHINNKGDLWCKNIDTQLVDKAIDTIIKELKQENGVIKGGKK